MRFVPIMPQYGTVDVPFWEDETAEVPGRHLSKPLQFYQNDVAAQLGRFGAIVTSFVPGEYVGGPHKRYGFRIMFAVDAMSHRIDCVAVPMRRETPAKKTKALSQACYLLARKLEAMSVAYIYEPNSMPLLPYMVGDGGATVTEAIQRTLALPVFSGEVNTE